jgi:hypothetical protein
MQCALAVLSVHSLQCWVVTFIHPAAAGGGCGQQWQVGAYFVPALWLVRCALACSSCCSHPVLFSVYVADQLNNRIRKVTPAGVTTTFAGNGTTASGEGTGLTAAFYRPSVSEGGMHNAVLLLHIALRTACLACAASLECPWLLIRWCYMLLQGLAMDSSGKCVLYACLHGSQAQ